MSREIKNGMFDYQGCAPKIEGQWQKVTKGHQILKLGTGAPVQFGASPLANLD